jgi:C1A family cysteine protease
MSKKKEYSRKKGYGWRPDLPDHRDYIYSAPAEVLASLPLSVDMRSQCPPIYDQGELGSCTGNAIAGAVQFDLIKQHMQDFIPSRLFIYYNERVIEGTVNSDSGASIRDGIKSVVNQGVCPETEWLYDVNKFTDEPSQQCYTEALKTKAASYSTVAQTLSQGSRLTLKYMV